LKHFSVCFLKGTPQKTTTSALDCTLLTRASANWAGHCLPPMSLPPHTTTPMCGWLVGSCNKKYNL